MSKQEILDFRTFIKKGRSQSDPVKRKSYPLRLYSLHISPIALIDVNFLLIGSGIVLIAITEKLLANAGMVTIASVISTTLRIAFPVVASGTVFYLIASSSFL